MSNSLLLPTVCCSNLELALVVNFIGLHKTKAKHSKYILMNQLISAEFILYLVFFTFTHSGKTYRNQQFLKLCAPFIMLLHISFGTHIQG